jgi:predicted  nucleic acid-binding Zn-ribbon protein
MSRQNPFSSLLVPRPRQTFLCLAMRSLSTDLDPINNELANAKRLIAAEDQAIKELTAKNELLEKNLRHLSDAVDALTARLNRGESK